MTGLFPKRKYAVTQGVYIKKGWLPENQWDGFLSPKDYPRLVNPKSGYFVSANNLVTSKNAKFGISHAF